MDFSWFGVTIIDIGVLSFSGAGFVWLFRRIALLEKQNLSLQEKVLSLQEDNLSLQEDNLSLQEKILSLNQANDTLRFRIETLEKENRDLEKRLDVLSGRYAEIKEMHEKLFPMLNQILRTLSEK